jgi:hypothetical protein
MFTRDGLVALSNRFPPKRLAKASASSGLDKQNMTAPFRCSGTGFLTVAAVGPERCGFRSSSKKKDRTTLVGVIGLIRASDITHLGNDNRANLTNQFSQCNN